MDIVTDQDKITLVDINSIIVLKKKQKFPLCLVISLVFGGTIVIGLFVAMIVSILFYILNS